MTSCGWKNASAGLSNWKSDCSCELSVHCTPEPSCASDQIVESSRLATTMFAVEPAVTDETWWYSTPPSFAPPEHSQPSSRFQSDARKTSPCGLSPRSRETDENEEATEEKR